MQMDVLTVITVGGLAIGFIGAVTSQLWKSSVEVEGRTTKQLTPTGWLSLGISLVGLMGSVASELIRVSEGARKQALAEQEKRWRSEMSVMLADAKRDIEQNLAGTIRGFSDNQNQFTKTQTEIIASKQTLLESALRQTNDIVMASQPLTSLSLRWQFKSNSTALWDVMKKGEVEFERNGESQAQEGEARIPYDVVRRYWTLLPLLSYVARLGEKARPNGVAISRSRDKDKSIVVLMPLDDAQNAILSFGDVGSKVNWYDDRPPPKGTPQRLLAAGFAKTNDKGTRRGGLTPSVTIKLASDRGQSESSYVIDWTIEPGALAAAVDRANDAIVTTAKLPTTLKLAVFYDIGILPFQRNHFGAPQAALWDEELAGEGIAFDSDLKDTHLIVKINGLAERERRYRLKKMYSLGLSDKLGVKVDTACTLLEFELQ